MGRKAPRPKEKQKNNGGRPSKFEQLCNIEPLDFPTIVYRLYRLGAEDEEVADLFGITTVTIHNWSLRYPEFFSARKKGKYEHDTEKVVKSGLLKRAIGYKYREITKERLPIFEERIIKTKDGKKKKEMVITGYEMTMTKSVSKEIPPDPTSIFFWLQNRDKEEWQPVGKIVNVNNKVDGEVTHKHIEIEESITENATKLPTDELRVAKQLLTKLIGSDSKGGEQGVGSEEPRRLH